MEQLKASATEESKMSQSLLSQSVVDIPLPTEPNEDIGVEAEEEPSTPQA